MLFNTIDFVIFLPLVITFYYLLPYKFRWVLLLFASYVFYGSWKLEYLVFIVFSTFIDYWSGIQMGKKEKKSKRRPFLIISLLSNLGLLFFFKYYNFFASNLNEGLGTELNIIGDLVLPVGISFYTFQTLSYSVDIYHGRLKPEKHLGYFALYVSFFPQLVAGPIERFDRLNPQFKKKHTITYNNIVNGLRLILFGLFIKMVIADNLSSLVEKIYETPLKYSSFDLLLGSIFYSFQIYSDFFGYSIIAIGSAKMLGINLMDNFKTPYLSQNIAEFWTRWHISLSTWFRDYLYYPMGGNRVGKFKWYLNILTVFIVSGIWHGANWTFIFWGCLFGIVYLLEKSFSFLIPKKKTKLVTTFLVLKTFVLTTLIWIFFRSDSLETAKIMLFRIFEFTSEHELELYVSNVVWCSLTLFIISEFLLYNSRFEVRLSKIPLVLRWGVYAVLIFSVIVFAGVEDFQFIYFQF